LQESTVRPVSQAEAPAAGLDAEVPARYRAGWVLAFSLILPLALYVGLASRFIGAGVGYEMDEALYVQSAVFLLRGGGGAPPFVTGRGDAIRLGGRRWPVMIIPYVGAVKAYVALPLFKVFGIRTEVARFAGVLLGAVGIAGLVALLATQVSPAAGLVAGALLAVHPSYLDYTVFDNGGVSVWMAAMGLIALTLVNLLRRPSPFAAFLLGIGAGLGIWARANVLWLLAAAAAAALVGFGRRAAPRPRQFTAASAGGLLGALPLILYEIRSDFVTLRYISAASQALTLPRFGARLRALVELMISDGEQRSIWWGPPLPSWQMALGGALLVLVAASLFVGIGSDDSDVPRWRRAFSASAIVLTGILLTSGLGVSRHHLVAVLPLPLAALATLSLELTRRSRRAAPLLALAAAGLLALFLSWDFRIDRGLRRTGGKYVWTSAISDVAVHLESHPVPPNRLKVLQWGFQNNLYVASGGTVHGSELFWGATKALSARGIPWKEELRDGGSFLFYLFPTSPAPEALEGFSAALAEYQGPGRRKVFPDRSGADVIALVEIPSRTAIADQPPGR
jgi:hypothetical protein